jgi:hypothetical protein
MQANTLEAPVARPALREPVCWQLTLSASYEVSIEYVLTCTASSESVASLFLLLRAIKCQLKLHNDRCLLPRYTHEYSDLRHFTSLLAPNDASAMDGPRGPVEW